MLVNDLFKTVQETVQGAFELGDRINADLEKPISRHSERIVRILSRTDQDAVSVDRHNHHYKLEINRDSDGRIVSIDVIRARHKHHGVKLTFSIVQNGGKWTAKSCAADPLNYTRVYKRIQRISSELESSF